MTETEIQTSWEEGEKASCGVYEYVVEEEEEREKVDVPEFLVRKFTPSRQLIASERVIDGLDVKEICLTNGARIILKRTKDEDRQITLTAFAKGGASVLTPEHYPLLEGLPGHIQL